MRATTLTHCKEIRKPVADKTQTGPLTVAQIVNGQIRDQIDPLKIRQAFNLAIGTEEAAVESEIVKDGSTSLPRIYSESPSDEKFRSAAVPLELNGACLILQPSAGWLGCQSPEKRIKQLCVSNASGGCNCAAGAPRLCKRRVIDRMFPARFFEAVRNYALSTFRAEPHPDQPRKRRDKSFAALSLVGRHTFRGRQSGRIH